MWRWTSAQGGGAVETPAMGPGGRDDQRLQERCLDRNTWDVQTDWMTGYGERRERPRMTPRCFTQMPCHVQKQEGWGKSVWCWGLRSSLGTCYAGKPVQQGRPSTKKKQNKNQRIYILKKSSTLWGNFCRYHPHFPGEQIMAQRGKWLTQGLTGLGPTFRTEQLPEGHARRQQIAAPRPSPTCLWFAGPVR